ncbi:MAG TPA: GTP 3',8-cyclase MoaA [Clostridia bacterium]|nr:GTP 3',8-cyclase MoaA [Clostridia bacterium]
MEDSFHRQIDYLRISVTDRCNLRCRYCMPADGVHLKTHEEILSLEEIFRLVEVAVSLGFTKFRLTGGEPLVRKGLVSLVERMVSLDGVRDITMTTNGILLPQYAGELKKAGLKRVNISLDTLKKDRFAYITRIGQIERVYQGIEASLEAGLKPVKINVVVVRGFNDDEILDFAHLTRERPLHVRFIELMPIGESDGTAVQKYVPVEEIKEILSRHDELLPAQVEGSGPADYVRLPESQGTIGFIGALSRHFCSTCNRLRLTAEGKLRPCLQKDVEFDLRTLLRQGVDQGVLRSVFLKALEQKPERHNMEIDGWGQQKRIMSQIGG